MIESNISEAMEITSKKSDHKSAIQSIMVNEEHGQNVMQHNITQRPESTKEEVPISRYSRPQIVSGS